MSRHSPGPVENDEQIARFVFSPVHVTRNGALKPSLTHADHKGCSVQRVSIASDEELSTFVKSFLEINSQCAWLGVVTASCNEIRRMSVPNENRIDRAACVYDTAEPNNAAHAEICRARDFADADPLELRRELLRLFEDGAMADRQTYRAGNVWAVLPQDLKDRTGK